jgi:hypothetical protein
MSVAIDVKDIGPITEFEHELSEPGLHILKGDQGVGKTTILRTVELATNGKTADKPTKRDGTPRGKATIGGKTLKISKVVRESGELSVDGLGDLDVSVLHTPKFKAAETRDAYRIKTLVHLAATPADVTLFHPLVGGKDAFDQLVDEVDAEDLLMMAGQVKRKLEKASRDEEERAERAKALTRAKLDSIEGVDLSVETYNEKLQTHLEEQIALRSKLEAEHAAAVQAREAAENAHYAIEDAEANYNGPTVDTAELQYETASTNASEAKNLADYLQRQLTEAQTVYSQAYTDSERAYNKLEAARQHASTIAAWQEQINALDTDADAPTSIELDAAERRIKEARAAVTAGMLAREALKAREAAKASKIEAQKHFSTAKKLREAAASTENVITNAIATVPNCPLKVHNDDSGNPRLVLKTSRDEREPFDRLSDGERWRIILPLCVAQNRLIVLSQAAFGELSPSSRKELHALAVEFGCYILTAQADDGELRAEIYEG